MGIWETLKSWPNSLRRRDVRDRDPLHGSPPDNFEDAEDEEQKFVSDLVEELGLELWEKFGTHVMNHNRTI